MSKPEAEKGRQVLWYIRRTQQVKGPFPSGTLRRFVAVGRVKLTDQVSRDKENWGKVSDTPEVVPPDIREAIKEGRAEELLMARMREDERTGRDRRKNEDDEKYQQRRKGERRQVEEDILQKRRSAKTDLRAETRERSVPKIALLVTAVIVVIAVSYGFIIGAPPQGTDPDCQAPPAAGVNWRNCRFDQLMAESTELRGAMLNNAVARDAKLSGAQLMSADMQYADLGGADMSYADLTGALLKGSTLRRADLTNANLTNADLSFADLTGATIGGTVFTGANLRNAIWRDGKTCRPESIGRCIPE